jgi:hypothetical protein
MEEFCGEEGVFELPAQLQAQQQGSGSSGTAFAPLFANLLQLLYDVDLVEEAAINSWAEEKQHADEEEKVFLNKVGGGGGGAVCWFWWGLGSIRRGLKRNRMLTRMSGVP